MDPGEFVGVFGFEVVLEIAGEVADGAVDERRVWILIEEVTMDGLSNTLELEQSMLLA